MNRKGPRTAPCGTPQCSSFSFTYWEGKVVHSSLSPFWAGMAVETSTLTALIHPHVPGWKATSSRPTDELPGGSEAVEIQGCLLVFSSCLSHLKHQLSSREESQIWPFLASLSRRNLRSHRYCKISKRMNEPLGKSTRLLSSRESEPAGLIRVTQLRGYMRRRWTWAKQNRTINRLLWPRLDPCNGCCPPFLKGRNEADNLSKSCKGASCPCVALCVWVYVCVCLCFEWFCVIQLCLPRV